MPEHGSIGLGTGLSATPDAGSNPDSEAQLQGILSKISQLEALRDSLTGEQASRVQVQIDRLQVQAGRLRYGPVFDSD